MRHSANNFTFHRLSTPINIAHFISKISPSWRISGSIGRITLSDEMLEFQDGPGEDTVSGMIRIAGTCIIGVWQFNRVV